MPPPPLASPAFSHSPVANAAGLFSVALFLFSYISSRAAAVLAAACHLFLCFAAADPPPPHSAAAPAPPSPGCLMLTASTPGSASHLRFVAVLPSLRPAAAAVDRETRRLLLPWLDIARLRREPVPPRVARWQLAFVGPRLGLIGKRLRRRGCRTRLASAPSRSQFPAPPSTDSPLLRLGVASSPRRPQQQQAPFTPPFLTQA